MGLGALLSAMGVFASGSAAWQGSCYDNAPTPGAWSEFRVELPGADVSKLAGVGEAFTDGVLEVTLSGAGKADSAAPLTSANVGSIDFTANPGVAAVYVGAGGTADKLYLYHSATTTGTALRG